MSLEESIYKCEFCDKTFLRAFNLREHLQYSHGGYQTHQYLRKINSLESQVQILMKRIEKVENRLQEK